MADRPELNPVSDASDLSGVIHRSSFGWLSVVVILVAATVVRGWLIGHAEMISRDGVTYIKMAREWAVDPSGVVKNYSYHVGYPAAISAMHRFLGMFGLSDSLASWELAGRLVSLLAALVATVAIWGFAAITFDLRIALLSALLLCAARKWAILGADVMSDALAMAFQTWAVLMALVALMRLKERCASAILLALGVGICGGLGYLVRPESLVVVGMAVVLWLASQLWNRSTPWKVTVGSVVVAVGSAAACAAPYALAIGTLTKKKRIDQLVPLSGVFPLAMTGNSYESGMRELVNQLTEAMHPVLFFLALGWLVLWIGFRLISRGQNKAFDPAPRPAGAAMMVIAAAAFIPLGLGLHHHNKYLNYRHVLLLGLLLSPLAGAGLVLGGYVVCDALKRFSQSYRIRAAYVLLPLLLCPMLLHALKPLKQNQSHYRDAAICLAQMSGPGDFFLARSPWIFHYSQARGEYYYTDELTPEMLLARIDGGDPVPTFLVYSDDELAVAAPALREMLGTSRFREIRRFAPSDPRSSDSVHIYRIVRASPVP